MTSSESDFDAAKAVVEQLKALDKERQERVLRWVAESLKLNLGPVSQGHVQRPDLGATAQETHLLSHPPPHSAAQHRPIDIKTFVNSKSPKSDVQFAAVVAYYYRFEAPPETRRETIDSDTLQEAARLTGRRRTKPLVTLNNAKTLGYLDAPERGQFRINNVGENLVAMTLPGSEETRTRRKPNRKAKPTKRGGRSKKR